MTDAIDSNLCVRPQGTWEVIQPGSTYKVKRLIVNPGESLSHQMHYHRSEHWVVVQGTARVTIGGKEYIITENQSTYIPQCIAHWLSNPGKMPLVVIEVQNGAYLEEDDIVRFPAQ
jgi:mannose-6-phosphate isomerase-like protein (cupin superfamily)